MKNIFQKLRVIGISVSLFGVFVTGGQAQQASPADETAAPFASENAILDTAVLFAIGAREAQQSLRGSFGWPTFQEGVVEGIYFRFDPDGYARFAPGPRLDTDVFEVICRPRTFSCMGRKGTLSVVLTGRGQVQLKIDDLQQGDRFFVSDGISDIELPGRILQPLDTQLEILLSTGGDLLVNRGEVQKDRISLTGFYPMVTYLRWVSARQDYTILPRGWPIPNSTTQPHSGVTQASNWQSPMPQPVNYPTESVQQIMTSPARQAQNTHKQMPHATQAQTDVAEVKGELKILRELLLKQNHSTGAPQQAASLQTQDPTAFSLTAPMDNQVAQQIAELQQIADQIQADLTRLRGQSEIGGTPLGQDQLPAFNTMPQMNVMAESASSEDKTIEMGRRLQYLMKEIGLDAKTALMLLQMNETSRAQPTLNAGINSNGSESMPEQHSPLYRDKVVSNILAELEESMPQANSTAKPAQVPRVEDGEYKLLSQYFRSMVESQ